MRKIKKVIQIVELCSNGWMEPLMHTPAFQTESEAEVYLYEHLDELDESGYDQFEIRTIYDLNTE